MKKIFQYIMLAVVTIVMASCTSDIEETNATTGKSNVQLFVGEFPTFGDSQTRTIGEEDPGKTSWAEGDELLLEMTSKTLGAKYAAFTYNGSKWELTSGELAYKEDEVPTFPHVYYAPNYKWETSKLVLKEGKVAGTDEYIEGMANITGDGKEIKVSFSTAARNYSRLRIATIPNENITVATEYFTPVAGSMEDSKEYSLTADGNGNIFLYGDFVNNSTLNVKYNGTSLAAYTFTKASEDAKSYALDATVISANSSDDIISEVAQKIADGKTNINIILPSETDVNVFGDIHSKMKSAAEGSIKLTLMGCKKIPSPGFRFWNELKSIVLPDVTEIGQAAFDGCNNLQRIEFGNLTKVYGKENTTYGIFDNCPTVMINLVLSKDQKIMKCSDLGNGQYCWTPDPTNKSYRNSQEHLNRDFLGYIFNSIKCGDKIYTD